MTWEIVFVFATIGVTVALFVTERFPIDQVAISIPVVLLAAGILSPAEAVAGFSDVATVTVAAMLVLSLGLVKTGAVAAIARWAQAAPPGGSRRRLLLLLLVAAAISPFLNNTAVVVVFVPIFVGVSHRIGEPPSLTLMPLSFAAILGGTVTLIGTSTNLVVYGMARERGFDELSMFSIAPLGLVYLAVGLLYLLTVGRKLLPRRAGEMPLTGKYDVREFLTELRVTDSTPATGRTFAEMRWDERHGVSVVGILRGERAMWGPVGNRRVTPGDLLYVQGRPRDLLKLAREQRLDTPAQRRLDRVDQEIPEDPRLAELMIAPNSPLVGRTLKESRFQQRHDVVVLAVQHHGRTVRNRLTEVELEPGDLLLVHGGAGALEALADVPGLVPLGEVQPPVPSRPRALVAVLILAGVVATAAVGIVPILPAALTGMVLMVFTRCVRLEEIYEELDWRIVFLLAGTIPLGIAMDETGAAAVLGHAVAASVGPLGPVAVVAAFYAVTSLLTEVMSNVAAAVVLTPIALLTAPDLGMNPYALLVAVMFGASASFMSPVGYQTNTLVFGPGGYTFRDYVRVGGPLNLLLMVVAAALIPLLWPS